jgi:hypothetical protein
MNTLFIDIQERGWKSLVKELGLADATRFMLFFDSGRGNYTRERQKNIKKIPLQQIMEEIKQNRKK